MSDQPEVVPRMPSIALAVSTRLPAGNVGILATIGTITTADNCGMLTERPAPTAQEVFNAVADFPTTRAQTASRAEADATLRQLVVQSREQLEDIIVVKVDLIGLQPADFSGLDLINLAVALRSLANKMLTGI